MLRSLPMQKPDLVEHWIVLSLWRYVCNIQTWRILAILKLLQAYIEAGAAGVHFEGKNITCRHLYKPVFVHTLDQLGSEKKCGHMGFYFCLLLFSCFYAVSTLHSLFYTLRGKVLIPTSQHIRHLNAARLAADVCGVPTIIVARTDAESAPLLTRQVYR